MKNADEALNCTIFVPLVSGGGSECVEFANYKEWLKNNFALLGRHKGNQISSIN